MLLPLCNSDACSDNEGIFLVDVMKKKKSENAGCKKKRKEITTRNVTYLL